MSTSDYGERASARQPQIPAVIPGGLYTRQQLINNLHISNATFADWIKAGLEMIEVGNSKRQFFLGDDVLKFFTRFKKARA